MDDVKGKAKDLIKKFRNPFVVTPKFKGQGHKLGSQSSTVSSSASNGPHRRAVSEEMPPLSSSTDAQRPSQNFLIAKAASTPATAAAFDPFTSVIGSHKSSSLNLTQCPVCQKWWNSETEVSAHLEECLATSSSGWEAVRILLLGGPSNATLGVFVRLLSNILGDSKAEKFRRVRLANPKIRETVGMALGGVEFLESVGFHLIADGEEVVAVMDDTSETQLGRIKQALVLLEPHYASGSLPSITASQLSSQPSVPANQLELRKVDRQMRLFHTSDENQAAKIELPDSFFELTASEVKMEAASRKKRLEEGQLLIPKSFRAKQASIAQRRYKAALIRIQFPDGIVLQGMFLPGELTSAIYQYVASVLNNANTEFELSLPSASKCRVVPSSSPDSSEKAAITLAAADLVPTALLKFRPLGLSGFTGLRQEYVTLCEPLTSIPFPTKG
ncbi:unnamed protein product [Sphagnum troendelagicum]|uniref:UBX domain-containing protein n=1 Tax=Sphagnum troendelagicum TaxID=128251 RepID=A0ABP0UWN2_9BRYO